EFPTRRAVLDRLSPHRLAGDGVAPAHWLALVLGYGLDRQPRRPTAADADDACRGHRDQRHPATGGSDCNPVASGPDAGSARTHGHDRGGDGGGPHAPPPADCPPNGAASRRGRRCDEPLRELAAVLSGGHHRRDDRGREPAGRTVDRLQHHHGAPSWDHRDRHRGVCRGGSVRLVAGERSVHRAVWICSRGFPPRVRNAI
ncbi:MAG: hypothetical protein AVDCRST_MAG59-4556, partial [uncultured Thermomicrobiales bacterium]